MMDFDAARAAMVEGQVRVSDVTDPRLLQAMREVPRERFTPKSKHALAYGDLETPVSDTRLMLRPRDFAKLVQALHVKPTDLALDLACGRGYSTAVLARLAEAVVGVESEAALAEKAGEALVDAGVDNAAVVQADLKAGAPDQGPFDVIFVNGAVESPPSAWLDQLAEGGRLGVIVANGPIGRARVFTKAGGVVGDRIVFDSGAPILPGFERVQGFQFD